jgi:hypothetical protein
MVRHPRIDLARALRAADQDYETAASSHNSEEELSWWGRLRCSMGREAGSCY